MIPGLLPRRDRRSLDVKHTGWFSPARLELALLDPQPRRRVRIVAAHLVDEPLRVVATDRDRQILTGKCRIGGGTMRQPLRHRAPRPEQRDGV